MPLCLIGFSGYDPNFLQWAGWVRDHLGGSARRIYLVGNLRLERATRRYLEAHNIAPIDLSPLVKHLGRELQHTATTQIFIDELRKAKPARRHEWKLTANDQFPLPRTGDAYRRVHKDHSFAGDLLKKTIPLFKADRESYPGWQVCPVGRRQSLPYADDAYLLLRKPVLDHLNPKFRAEAVFEILWRRATSFTPIDVPLASALTELVDAKLPEVDPDMRLEFALALMRHARVSCDDAGMNGWGTVIAADAAADFGYPSGGGVSAVPSGTRPNGPGCARGSASEHHIRRSDLETAPCRLAYRDRRICNSNETHQGCDGRTPHASGTPLPGALIVLGA